MIGNNVSKYIVEIVDLLNQGIEVVTPKAGFLEDLLSPSAFKAKARLVEIKVKTQLYDMISRSPVLKQLDDALEAAKTAQKDLAKMQEEAQEKLDKEKSDTIKAMNASNQKLIDDLEKQKSDFEREMAKRKDEFEFDKAQSEARIARQEKILEGDMNFKGESAKKNIEYTQALIEDEKKIFENELKRRTEQFEKDKAHAEEILKKDLEGKLAIANAEIDRLKAEAEINFSYDIGIVEKKVYSEVYDKLKALETALAEAGLKDEIIEKLHADVEYFRSRFEEERVTTNAFGAKSLDSALDISKSSVAAFGANLGKEQKPVTVNVDAKSISGKKKSRNED